MTKLTAKTRAVGTAGTSVRSRALVLGIDGGGTRTTAWLSDERRRILGRGVAGPSNPISVGLTAGEHQILAAARLALSGLKPRRPPKLKAVCLGLAGADRPEISRPIASWLRRQLPAEVHVVTTDAVLALEAAVGRVPGIVVVAGTGSIACARDAQGRLHRVGGWGSTFDDAGSGYHLGRQAVRAALRAFDGQGPKTALGPAIARRFGIAGIAGIIALGLDPPQIASVAPLVIKAAGRGDAVARLIVEEAAHDLAALVVLLAHRLRIRQERLPVFCAGGLFRASAALRRSFARHLRREVPKAQVRLLRRQAVEGAVALALRQART